ncbi:MAG: N-acetylmuramoyl-L-alanine amidase, partial [Pseudomonadota bacterium]
MSRVTSLILAGALALWGFCAPAASVLSKDSAVTDAGEGVVVKLAVSEPVPWRVFTLDGPRRLVVDLKGVDWPDSIAEESARAHDLRLGQAGSGWSRLVLSLDAPLAVDSAEMTTEDGAVLTLMLAPDRGLRATEPRGIRPKARRLAGDPRTVVVLDPGHGGLDPGAEADGLVEAELMLVFAKELAQAFDDTAFRVVLTRDSDVFVPLERRITRARAAGADVFLSLHADALPQGSGHASGATVYTLAEDASDDASRRLAERHDQTDLLLGLDLTGQADDVALVLMSLARHDTAPAANALADALVGSIRERVGRVNTRPRRSAAFSVLKAPDIPSVLIEIGFLSSATDRENLRDPVWRAVMAEAIVEAVGV